jgi:hypothetical protein
MMFLLGVPLLIFSFAIYNIVAFLLRGFAWSMEVVQFKLASGADLTITAGDLIVGGSTLVLLIEMIKAARLSRRSIVDHILSLVLFVAMLIEFLLVPEAGTATFLLLLVISFLDVTGGFAVSIRAAQRDISFSGADSAHPL